MVSRLFSLTSEDGDEDDGDDDDGGAEGAWEVRGWNVGQLDVLTMGAHTRRRRRRRSEKRSPFVSFCENLDVFLLWRRSLGSQA